VRVILHWRLFIDVILWIVMVSNRVQVILPGAVLVRNLGEPGSTSQKV
jgi:hypothetical protein